MRWSQPSSMRENKNTETAENPALQDSFLLYKEHTFDYNGDMEPIIFHVDVNSAFLSWEAVSRLKHQAGATDLRTIPAAVGGDVKKRRGIILARSLPAKQYGVRTGETVAEARKKCPELVLVPPSYGVYERASGELMGLLRIAFYNLPETLPGKPPAV